MLTAPEYPTAWNSLSVIRRGDTFRRSLVTYLFAWYNVIRARSALEALCNALYKCSPYLLTYLLTCLPD